MGTPLRALVVDDSELDAQLLVRELVRAGYDPSWKRVDTPTGLREALSREEWDAVLSDYTMPSFSGLEALNIVKATGLDLPVIFVSGTIGEETAVSMMKAGAHDYLMKGSLRRLGPAIDRELREAGNRRERRAAEESRELILEDLRRSNEELQRFAYVASHDLQEPLRMVVTYTELLAQRYRSQLPADPDLDAFIGYTLEGAYRIHRLIQDLLELSRVAAPGAQESPLDCDRLLDNALDNLSLAVREAGAIITRGSLPTVRANETQIIQLFQNLVANALKFRGKDPPRIRIEARLHGDEWIFSVADNGIGIEPQHADRIFEIFQRLHGRDVYPGSGLGLTLCRKIVERHRGRIWVESVPGRGSTFLFTLKA